MKTGISFLCHGKLKTPGLKAFESEFLKRLHRPWLPEICELKGGIDKALRPWREVNSYVICLSERGKLMGTKRFYNHLSPILSQIPIVFCIGSAEGFSEDWEQKADFVLGISPMTFSHQLARILLVEQLYRAQCFATGHPYHKE